MLKVFEVLFFLMGLFFSASVLSVNIMGIQMTAFTFLLMLTLLIKIVFELRIKIGKSEINTPIFWYYVLMCVSTALNMVLIKKEWVQDNIVFTISTIIGVFGYFACFSKEEKKKYFPQLLKGVKINCVIQMVWMYIQYFAFEYLSIPLNYRLGLAGSDRRLRIMDQLTGLTWERAELCVAFLVGILTFKNKMLKVLFAIAIILTRSRTGIIMLAIYFVFSIDYAKVKNAFKKLRLKEFVEILFVVGFVVIFWETIMGYIQTTIIRFENISREGSGAAHLAYYQRIPELLKKVPIINILLGYGPASSGYPYMLFYGKNMHKVWSVESAWLQAMWGTGIIGFCLYGSWFVNNVVYFVKKNKKVSAFFLTLLLGGVFYTVVPNWAMFFLMSLSALSVDITDEVMLDKNINV